MFKFTFMDYYSGFQKEWEVEAFDKFAATMMFYDNWSYGSKIIECVEI